MKTDRKTRGKLVAYCNFQGGDFVNLILLDAPYSDGTFLAVTTSLQFNENSTFKDYPSAANEFEYLIDQAVYFYGMEKVLGPKFLNPIPISLWDDGGNTFDRYTLLDSSGDVFGYSENAKGFDQFCGNVYEWGETIESYLSIETSKAIGRKVKPHKWPSSVIKAYNTRIQYMSLLNQKFNN
jgi:hypothetical protein